MEEQEDRELSEEEFNQMVDKLVASFSLFRWRWLGGPGAFQTKLDFHFNFHENSFSDRPTDDDEFLTFRLDMIDSGMKLITRHMTIEYGDGEAVLEFWKDSIGIYDLLSKVRCRCRCRCRYMCRCWCRCRCLHNIRSGTIESKLRGK